MASLAFTSSRVSSSGIAHTLTKSRRTVSARAAAPLSSRKKDVSLDSKVFRRSVSAPRNLAPLRNVRAFGTNDASDAFEKAKEAISDIDIPTKEPSTFEKFSAIFSNLFPIWTLLGAGLALKSPSTFSFMTTDSFTMALAVLMFSMGITMTVEDFKNVLVKPVPVAINFVACFVMMPVLALALAKVFNLSTSLAAGCVLVGSINGGQASNLCTYIAKGNVALSVIMTTATTFGTIVMTPLIAKMVLGTMVPVDSVGIIKSTIQVVLAPILIGVTANKYIPQVCRAVEPICPVVGVCATVVLVGASVAQCAGPILAAGWSLQFPLLALHLLGGLAGYGMARLANYDEVVSRTMAIETSMKSSAFGFLLASLHFSEYMVRVPSAVSVVWMALVGSTLAVVWRFIPIKDEKIVVL